MANRNSSGSKQQKQTRDDFEEFLHGNTTGSATVNSADNLSNMKSGGYMRSSTDDSSVQLERFLAEELSSDLTKTPREKSVKQPHNKLWWQHSEDSLTSELNGSGGGKDDKKDGDKDGASAANRPDLEKNPPPKSFLKQKAGPQKINDNNNKDHNNNNNNINNNNKNDNDEGKATAASHDDERVASAVREKKETLLSRVSFMDSLDDVNSLSLKGGEPQHGAVALDDDTLDILLRTNNRQNLPQQHHRDSLEGVDIEQNHNHTKAHATTQSLEAEEDDDETDKKPTFVNRDANTNENDDRDELDKFMERMEARTRALDKTDNQMELNEQLHLQERQRAEQHHRQTDTLQRTAAATGEPTTEAAGEANENTLVNADQLRLIKNRAEVARHTDTDMPQHRPDITPRQKRSSTTCETPAHSIPDSHRPASLEEHRQMQHDRNHEQQKKQLLDQTFTVLKPLNQRNSDEKRPIKSASTNRPASNRSSANNRVVTSQKYSHIQSSGYGKVTAKLAVNKRGEVETGASQTQRKQQQQRGRNSSNNQSETRTRINEKIRQILDAELSEHLEKEAKSEKGSDRELKQFESIRLQDEKENRAIVWNYRGGLRDKDDELIDYERQHTKIMSPPSARNAGKRSRSSGAARTGTTEHRSVEREVDWRQMWVEEQEKANQLSVEKSLLENRFKKQLESVHLEYEERLRHSQQMHQPAHSRRDQKKKDTERERSEIEQEHRGDSKNQQKDYDEQERLIQGFQTENERMATELKRLQRLEKQWKGADGGPERVYDGLISERTADLEAIRKELAATKAELDMQNMELRQLRLMRAKSHSNNANLQQNDELKDELKLLQKKFAQISAQLLEKERKCGELANETNRLRKLLETKVESATRACETNAVEREKLVESHVAETEALKQKIRWYAEQHVQMRTQQQQQQQQSSKAHHHQQHHQQGSHENTDQRGVLAALRQEFDKVRLEYEREIDDLKFDLANERQTNEILSEAKQNRADKKQLNEEEDALVKSRAKRQLRIDELKKQSERESAARVRLEEEVKTLRRQITSLQRIPGQSPVSGPPATTASASSKTPAIQKKPGKSQLKKDAADASPTLKTTKVELEAAKVHLTSQLVRAQAELTAEREATRQLREELQAAHTKLAAAEQQAERERSEQHANTETQLNSARVQFAVEHSQSELAKLQLALSEERADVKRLHAKLAQLAAERKTEQEAVADDREKREALETENRRLETELVDLRLVWAKEPQLAIADRLRAKLIRLEMREDSKARQIDESIDKITKRIRGENAAEIERWRGLYQKKNSQLRDAANELDLMMGVLEELKRRGFELPINERNFTVLKNTTSFSK